MKNVVDQPFESITQFTLLDYPEKTACILWFAGCNMKCAYCYNPEIVFGKGKLTLDKVTEFLKKRIGLLDGVVMSGGECTIHPNFVNIVARIKEMGFMIKIDTNGSMPWILEECIERKLIDRVALDFKAPKNKFRDVTSSSLFDRFERSMDLLIKSDITFEVRTTYHDELLNLNDLIEMRSWLKEKGYSDSFFIQQFISQKKIIGNVGEMIHRLDPRDQLFQEHGMVLRN